MEVLTFLLGIPSAFGMIRVQGFLYFDETLDLEAAFQSLVLLMLHSNKILRIRRCNEIFDSARRMR